MGRWIALNYRGALRFALAAPLLFLIPVLAELAQHVIEMRLGMYASLAAARHVADAADRTTWGFVKVIALTLPGYWFVRYLAFGDVRRATRAEQPALGLFLIQFALAIVLAAWALFGPGTAPLLGLTGNAGRLVTVVPIVLSFAFGTYLTAWYAAWPLGNRRMGPLASVRLISGYFWSSIVIGLASALPLTAVHYALSYGAMGRPPALAWAMLVLDALLAGYLALLIAGANYVAAARVAAAKGVSLAPREPPPQ